MREFTCALCGQVYTANEAKDDEMRAAFISRYGCQPEEMVDDEIVSLCDDCNDEYERKRVTDYETKLLPAILRAIAEERSDAVAINALNHAAEALEAMALERCVSCCHWGNNRSWATDDGRIIKSCNCPKFLYGYATADETVPTDGAAIENDEGWGMLTGPEFGCIHWAQSPPVNGVQAAAGGLTQTAVE